MFKQFFVKTNFVVLSILVGLCISIGIQGVSSPLTASGAAPVCENAICVPAGESAQWRSGNLVLNTGLKYETGLLVPYGNVGIGILTPSTKLDVLGNTLFEGKVLIGTGSVTANKQILTVQGNTESTGLCIGTDCITSWSDLKERLQSTGTSSGGSSSTGSSSGSSSGSGNTCSGTSPEGAPYNKNLPKAPMTNWTAQQLYDYWKTIPKQNEVSDTGYSVWDTPVQYQMYKQYYLLTNGDEFATKIRVGSFNGSQLSLNQWINGNAYSVGDTSANFDFRTGIGFYRNFAGIDTNVYPASGIPCR